MRRFWLGLPLIILAACSPAPSEQQAELGLSLAREGRLPEARAAFEQALALDSNQVKALYNLGLIHLVEGDAETAAVFFERFAGVRPDDSMGRYEWARSLVASGRMHEGLEQLQEAVRLGFDDYEALTAGDFRELYSELPFLMVEMTVAQRAQVAPTRGVLGKPEGEGLEMAPPSLGELRLPGDALEGCDPNAPTTLDPPLPEEHVAAD